MKAWFFARSPGTRAALIMIGCVLALLLSLLTAFAIIGWVGPKVFWLIPIWIICWIIWQVYKFVILVWTGLKAEIERGERERNKP